ncbi:MAG TPA: 2-amino-4-hydroxy-6-hydroxymethyldihydropteridine diphosphokinase [Rhodanobacter sp.]|nr:2-amino-4-hydroxy-6-hydroxymethyldihydropteridine diphosphokinase [Rhodanobacter sp.]
MREPARRWLLLLGSSCADDTLMHAALTQLRARGSATWLTPVQRFAADDGSARQFYNALLAWDVAATSAGAHAQIRQIELALGRDRTRNDEVAIDIDLLAGLVDGQWHAYAHALDKHEFDRALVRGLLHQAGVTVVRDDGAQPQALR